MPLVSLDTTRIFAEACERTATGTGEGGRDDAAAQREADAEFTAGGDIGGMA